MRELELDVEVAELGYYASLDLADDGEDGGRSKTEMILNILAGVGALAEVGHPESTDSAVFISKNTAATLCREIGVHGDGVDIDSAVSGSGGVGRDGNSCNVGHGSLSNHDAKVLVEAEEKSVGTWRDLEIEHWKEGISIP